MEPFIGHADVLAFAERRVNLHQDSVRRYKDQVGHLREGLAQIISGNLGFDLVKILYAGSVAKGTALSTINDLDVAVYLEKSQVPVDEKDAVPWMAERLREAYPQKRPGDIECHDHCARIAFKGTGLDVDVVPIIYEKKNDWGHLTDKYTGEKLRTNIRLHLDFVRKRKGQNPHFAQVARLAKWWAKQRKDENPGFKCKSFLLELLVARMSDSGSKLDDYPAALEEFFSYIVKTGLAERVAFHDYYPAEAAPGSAGAAVEVLDPVNPHNNVTGDYSAGHRDALVRAAEEAADAIREARCATTMARAVERWQAVLGPSFGGGLSGDGRETANSTAGSTAHSEHVASKVEADLQAMRRYYGVPAESMIRQLRRELAELLAGGYVARVQYGFSRGGEKVLFLEYAAQPPGSRDYKSGGVFARADVSGAGWNSYMFYSEKWRSLQPNDRQHVLDRIRLPRETTTEPVDGDGHWAADKIYASGDIGARRRTFRPA